MAIKLVKFEEIAQQRGSDYTKPPYRVPAKALDKNFKSLTPAEYEGDARPYSIDFNEDGWQIVPEVLFDVCENGKPRQYKFLCQKAI
jgi:hypothetical protein